MHEVLINAALFAIIVAPCLFSLRSHNHEETF
jgi:hypothetical protein